MKRKHTAAAMLAAAVLAGLPQGVYAMTQQEEEPIRAEAVQLARNGSYREALAMLERVRDTGYQGVPFWADYITILSWSGDDKTMIAMAEKRFGSDFHELPDYALLPLARGYARQGQAEKANALFKVLASHGNDDGAIVVADLAAAAGDLKGSEETYAALEKKGGDVARRAALSAAQQAVNRRDYVAAEAAFARAKTFTGGNADAIRDIDALRAPLYIRQGEPMRSVRILEPYVKEGKDNLKMYSDYLMALRLAGFPKQAAKDFETRAPKWEEMPPYGLQTVGDIYLRLGKFKKSHHLYDYLLKSTEIGYARLGDAYDLAMLGRDGDAIRQYQETVTRHPELMNAAALDANTFLAMGRLHLAREIYSFLGTTPEEKEAYQLRFAQAMTNVNENIDDVNYNARRDMRLDGRTYDHAASNVYHRLQKSTNEDIRTSATAGLAQTAVQRGEYATAKRLLTPFLKSSDAPDAMNAGAAYSQRFEHEADASYLSDMDNKNNHASEISLTYQQYLGGNFYGLGGLRLSPPPG